MSNRFGTDILIQAVDPGDAALFYVNQLGFEITDETPNMISLHPGPMRRGLRIAIGGMPSGPRAVVFTETPSLSYSPFSSCSPAAPRTRSLLAGLAESEFYGIRAHDPWAIGGATLLIAVVGLLAGLAPAVRAMRIEPVRALRYE